MEEDRPTLSLLQQAEPKRKGVNTDSVFILKFVVLLMMDFFGIHFAALKT